MGRLMESRHEFQDMELIQLPPDNELNDGLSPEDPRLALLLFSIFSSLSLVFFTPNFLLLFLTLTLRRPP